MFYEVTYNTRTGVAKSNSKIPSFMEDLIKALNEESVEPPFEGIEDQMSYVNSNKYEFSTVSRFQQRVDELEASLVLARKDLKEAIRKNRLDMIHRLGNGAVIRWKSQFKTGQKDYTYVAVKVDDNWYVSGSNVVRNNDSMKDALQFCTELTIMTPDKEL